MKLKLFSIYILIAFLTSPIVKSEGEDSNLIEDINNTKTISIN